MAGTWASGGSRGTDCSTPNGNGSQTDTLSHGGNSGGSIATTEEYNGTSFSAGGNLGTARNSGSGGGAGQSDGLSASGADLTSSEEYNGTSWSAGGTLTTGRTGPYGGGDSQGDAWIAAGRNNTSAVATTEEYNGTSWGSGGNVGTNATRGMGCGTTSAGLKVSGTTDTSGNDDNASNTAVCEEYNGTSWAAGGSVSTARLYLMAGGIQTNAFCVGGRNTAGSTIATTEEYNGTTWSAGGDAAGGTWNLGYGAGATASAGIAFSNGTRCEEYTITPATAIKTVNDLAKASVKTVNDLAIASVKTIKDLA